MGKKSRRTKPVKARMPFVARTFEGLPQEGDWIALREFVPSATAVVTLRDSTPVRICTLLPGAGAGLVRPDGEIWVGLQVLHNHGDISRDLAHVIEIARDTAPGTAIRMTDPGVGDRLQDLLDPQSRFDLELHDDFSWWIVEEDRDSAQAAAALQDANATIAPTTRLTSVPFAYASDLGDHTFLRWTMTEPEDALLDGFARLRTDGGDAICPGTRLIGIFRAHGVLTPVWEIEDAGIAAVEAAAPGFAERLAAATAAEVALTPEQRSARRDLANRQVTIR